MSLYDSEGSFRAAVCKPGQISQFNCRKLYDRQNFHVGTGVIRQQEFWLEAIRTRAICRKGVI